MYFMRRVSLEDCLAEIKITSLFHDLKEDPYLDLPYRLMTSLNDLCTLSLFHLTFYN